MNLKDASARFKAARSGAQAPEQNRESQPNQEESYHVRAKMIGVLIRDARLNAERTIDDCAQLLRVPPEQMLAWEYGDNVPSLPQIELLSYYLGVPVSHFWGTETLEAKIGRHFDIQTEYAALRDRIIGALLRQARDERGLSLEELSKMSAIPPDELFGYELGETAIPLHRLTVLADAVNKNTSYFLEGSGHIGQWLAMREEWRQFTTLREDIRRFAANPRNIGFIEIAIMLSQMPVDKLRDVGASILDITR